MKYIVAFVEVDTAEDFDASVADVTNAVTEISEASVRQDSGHTRSNGERSRNL